MHKTQKKKKKKKKKKHKIAKNPLKNASRVQ